MPAELFGGGGGGNGNQGRPNIKGQRYTLGANAEGTSSDEDDEGDRGEKNPFVNYAEVLGENLYLQAEGYFEEVGPVQVVGSDEETKNPSSSSENTFLGALVGSLFGGGGVNDNKGDSLLPTPYDYLATVTGASVTFLQKYSIDFSIQGTGTTRVLYADDRLRIFVSPTETNVTGGVLRKGVVGDAWESEGLVVVQVRGDLVYPDFSGDVL